MEISHFLSINDFVQLCQYKDNLDAQANVIARVLSKNFFIQGEYLYNFDSVYCVFNWIDSINCKTNMVGLKEVFVSIFGAGFLLLRDDQSFKSYISYDLYHVSIIKCYTVQM